MRDKALSIISHPKMIQGLCALVVLFALLDVAKRVMAFPVARSESAQIYTTRITPQLLNNISNLFGEAVSTVVAEPTVPLIDLSRFELVGVLTSPVLEESLAFILSRDTHEQAIYRVGDQLANQAIISDIRDDTVFIKQNNRTLSMQFPEPAGPSTDQKGKAFEFME